MRKYNNKGRNVHNSKYKRGHKNHNKKRGRQPTKIRGTSVVPYPDEHIDSVIKRFRKVVDSAGIIRELKKREYYLTRSQKRREKKKRALKRLRKRGRK